MNHLLISLSVASGLLLSEAREVASVQPFDSIYVPDSCPTRARSGDHVLVQFDLRNKERPSDTLFSMKSWEQRHYVLGDANVPAAFNVGLVGMCLGEKRRLTNVASDFGVSAETINKVPFIISDVELLAVTTATDYKIFDLIDSGNVFEVMELVENRTGVNAVDKYGNSALMVKFATSQQLCLHISRSPVR